MSNIRFYCYKITEHKIFKILILIAIAINTISLSIHYFMMPEQIESIQKLSILFFIGLFTIEATMKIIALRYAYFNDYWNRFDFTIIVVPAALIIV